MLLLHRSGRRSSLRRQNDLLLFFGVNGGIRYRWRHRVRSRFRRTATAARRSHHCWSWDLTTVGVGDLTTVGVGDLTSVGVGDLTTVGVGDLLKVGVCDGVFLRVGGIEGSAKLDPRDMVSVLVLDDVFDVRPLLLRWVVGLLSGEGGFNWVGVYSGFGGSSMVGVKFEGEPSTVGAADRDRRTGVCGVDGLLTVVETDLSRHRGLPRRAFVSSLLVVLRERALCMGVSSPSLADFHDD